MLNVVAVLATVQGQLVTLIVAAPAVAFFVALVTWSRWTARPLPKHDVAVGWLGRMTRATSLVSFLATVLLAIVQTGQPPLKLSPLGLGIYIDALSMLFLLLVNTVALFASWYATEVATADDPSHAARFHALFNGFHLTMLLVPMVNNLVFLWMAIELTTLASTLLVNHSRTRPAVEAAWKYIMITTAGIVFALLGTLFLANAITSQACLAMQKAPGVGGPVSTCASLGIRALDWSQLATLQVARLLTPGFVTLSFMFILIGYGTKAGFAPMHTWLPDGHGEAPAPVSALLSGVLLKCAAYAILRFYIIVNLSRGGAATFTSAILLTVGLLSLVVATPFILNTGNPNFKRVLAYHSLQHMGIIAFGIGIGGTVALFGALLHALNHALTKALLFLSHEQVKRHGISGDVLKTMPWSGLLLLFGGLGLVGAPPFGPFLSEFIILYGALQRVYSPGGSPIPGAVYIAGVVLFIATLAMIFGGLMVHLSRLLLAPSAAPASQPVQPEVDHENKMLSAFGQESNTLHSSARRDVAHTSEPLRPLIPLFLLLTIILVLGVSVPRLPMDLPALLNRSVCILQQGVTNGCQLPR